MNVMKYELTLHALDVVGPRGIKLEWIELAIESPTFKSIVCDVEVHYFKTIEENLHRCLKVVINPVSMKIITVYFDRNMRKKGCKDENKI